MRNQFSVTEKIIQRLVYPTIFEVVGWKRIEAVSISLKAFRIDVNSISLSYEIADLPISIANKTFYENLGLQHDYEQTNKKTFLVFQ